VPIGTHDGDILQVSKNSPLNALVCQSPGVNAFANRNPQSECGEQEENLRAAVQ
jgi:hypothetical protein